MTKPLYTKYQVLGSSYLSSLTKILGQGVKDVRGYLSCEFGEPVFKLCEIVLENGRTLHCEGEHDFPYLVNGTAKFDADLLQAIYDSDPDNAEDE